MDGYFFATHSSVDSISHDFLLKLIGKVTIPHTHQFCQIIFCFFAIISLRWDENRNLVVCMFFYFFYLLSIPLSIYFWHNFFFMRSSYIIIDCFSLYLELFTPCFHHLYLETLFIVNLSDSNEKKIQNQSGIRILSL